MPLYAQKKCSKNTLKILIINSIVRMCVGVQYINLSKLNNTLLTLLDKEIIM